MKTFLILAVYTISVVMILAFMMGASRKEKDWHEHK